MTIETSRLGASDLRVSKICLGTMTFGEQVGAEESFGILDQAVERGIDFIDTAEMYPVPTRAATYGHTETIIGDWLAARPGMRQRIVLATKVAGPGRNLDWVRGGRADLTAQDILAACDASLQRLRTDCIDLYQIHWPNRNVPIFGAPYFDPAKEAEQSSVAEQLDAMARLVKAGKVRRIGVSNETPWGVSEFVRVAAAHGLPRIVSVQNAYALVNRVPDNGLDEVMWREQVSLLAYSPLGFGTLTGKYAAGIDAAPAGARLKAFDAFRSGRWGRPEVIEAANEYAAIAAQAGMSLTRLALAFCYQNWRVASTIIGVTSVAQLEENLAAWGTTLSPEVLRAIDEVRWRRRDPAQ
jgi:aryl-alcohol dehydrogenase-like predicted oxidoreductase